MDKGYNDRTMAEMPDGAKTLGDEKYRRARRALIQQDHIAPLTHFVEQIRKERGLSTEVPFFDPLDGGITARALFLLEAPGRKAVQSGFVSRNNPDETARNLYNLFVESGLRRSHTVIWNIVPWYIGSATKIRQARRRDIEDGLSYLKRLVLSLPELKAVVLLGRNAQTAKASIAAVTTARILESPHPSPLSVNTRPDTYRLIRGVFENVAKHLAMSSSPSDE